jgi:transcriptional regulator
LKSEFMGDWGNPLPEDIAKALDLRRRGKSLQEIADVLKCTRLDAFRILQRAGVLANR